MMQKIRITLMALIPLSFIQAAETATWGDDNTVTYSVSVSDITLGNTARQVSLSQFNANTVAAHEGGSAFEYTLSRVVLTVDGTIYGSVWFQNNDAVAANPNFGVANGSSKLTYGGYTTGTETFSEPVNLGSVAPNTRIDTPVNVVGTGSVSTPEITSALASFIGSDTISTMVTMKGSGFFDSEANSWDGSVSIKGAANVSVMYEYTVVPEPTSLALLGFGCAALLARRRVKRPSLAC